MGWETFSSLVSRGAWSKEDAFFGILFAAAAADGEVAPAESEEITALAHRAKTLKALGAADLKSMYDRVFELFQRDFAAALNDACNSIPKEACDSIFAHAADIVFADGKVVTKEAEFLATLADKLQLDKAATEKTIDVLRKKNEF